MSYLDNLENNLNALERLEEKDPEKIQRDRERREAERNAALLRAPYAEALKTSPFTSELLGQCRVLGRGLRVLVQFTWLDEVLRLDAKEKRLELVPTAKGVEAVYSVSGTETKRELVDFSTTNPEAFAKTWLES